MALKGEILESEDTTPEQKELARKIKKDFAKISWEKGIKDEAELFAELDVLHDYLYVIELEAAASKKVKDAKAALNKKVFAKYRELTEDEIKTLVVDDKWLTRLDNSVKSELERISQNLTQRIKTLAERYKTPLPQIVKTTEDLSTKVDAHLAKMGFASTLSATIGQT